MGFSVAPGTLTALSGTSDDRAYYVFDGDLSQMGTIEEALREAGFPVVKSNVYPGFRESDKDRYVEALRFVYERRIEGWWNQRDALIRFEVCTYDEYKDALHARVKKDRE